MDVGLQGGPHVPRTGTQPPHRGQSVAAGSHELGRPDAVREIGIGVHERDHGGVGGRGHGSRLPPDRPGHVRTPTSEPRQRPVNRIRTGHTHLRH